MTAGRPATARSLLLTGLPGCGKTTLVRRVIDRLGTARLAGFYTEERRGPDGRRVGFDAIGLNGGTTTLASVASSSRDRVGRYGVELRGFEELIRDELERDDEDVDLFVIDEIGKMECLSARFVALTRQLLDGARPVLATVAMKGGGFIGRVKERRDVELVEVTPGNREDLVGVLAERLRSALPT